VTRAEFAGVIFTLVVFALAIWHGTRPRKKKIATGPEACERYIAEMRSHLRQAEARRAASELLR
jgi:hypothetical protein